MDGNEGYVATGRGIEEGFGGGHGRGVENLPGVGVDGVLVEVLDAFHRRATSTLFDLSFAFVVEKDFALLPRHQVVLSASNWNQWKA